VSRAILCAAAAVVFLPLGLYFFFEPGAFAGRANDVALPLTPTPDALRALGENAERVLGMFFVRGDLEWRHNLAGRPVLDWIALLPFTLGLGLTLRRWGEPSARLVIFWFTLMLLPTVITSGAPDYARAIGALPAVYIVAAWGWEAFANWIVRRAPRLAT